MVVREDDQPKSLRDPAAIARRLGLLSEPHIAPLTEYVASLRLQFRQVPDFDPLDGGVNATMLFLFEKPGPMTDDSRPGRMGSGFISRNNDDETAKAIWKFMNEAGIPRHVAVIWNLIPWWDGQIRFTGKDRDTAVRELKSLFSLLPKLTTVVLVGRTAQKARPCLSDLRAFDSAHPSPKVRSMNKAKWDAIPGVWREAWLQCGGVSE